MARVQIRPLKNLEEFRACECIQKTVWGTVGVGSEVMSVTQKYGGAVLGAFVHGRLAGFIFAFLARRQGRLIHWSHMMAVEPECRNLGLGFRMKLGHRRLALEQGIKSICWTYDPLQSRNAALNIARLGARVEEYMPDCYGRFPSLIEKGLPSDRFVVNWRIASPAVARRLRESSRLPLPLASPHVNETQRNKDGLLENRRLRLDLRVPRLLVEIPGNTDAMRARALGLALRWRLETRKIFRRYLSADYRVEDFHSPRADPGGRCYYVLCRAGARAP